MYNYSKIFKACFSAFICLIFSFSAHPALADGILWDTSGESRNGGSAYDSISTRLQDDYALNGKTIYAISEWFSISSTTENPVIGFALTQSAGHCGTTLTPTSGDDLTVDELHLMYLDTPCVIDWDRGGWSYFWLNISVSGSNPGNKLFNYSYFSNYQNAQFWGTLYGSDYAIPEYGFYVYPNIPVPGETTTSTDGRPWFSGSYDFSSSTWNSGTGWRIVATDENSDNFIGYNYDVFQNETGFYGEWIPLPNGTYTIEYFRTEKIEENGILVTYSYPVDNDIATTTLIVENSTFINPNTIIEYEISELEDCAELSFPNKWFCEIKNAVMGLFAPSNAKIQEFKNSIGEINNRFPVSYIKSAQSNWQTVYNGITTTSNAINISILGSAASSVSFEVFNQSGLRTIILYFLGFIFISAWIFWAIKFLQRIF
jgi:hypothetical protein